MFDEGVSSGNQLSRRELGELALGKALGAAALGWSQSSFAVDVDSPCPSGIKLSCLAPANPTDEDLLYLQQMGRDAVNVDNFSDLTFEQQIDLEVMQSVMKRYAGVGIEVNQFASLLEHPPVEIYLSRPCRDEAIETYKMWIRAMGKAGIHHTRWDWTSAQALQSGVVETRGAQARDFDLNGSNFTTLGYDNVTGSDNAP